MPISKKTKPADVISMFQHKIGRKVAYQAAHGALRVLQGSSIHDQREAYRHLTAYIEAIKKVDPCGRHEIEIDEVTSRFQRLFIGPSASRTVFSHVPKYIACDGTFTKTEFRQTLLFASCIDSNDEISVLAWALVESENTLSWSFFLRNLRLYVFCILGCYRDCLPENGKLISKQMYSRTAYRAVYTY
jgi:hypothetical protein